MEVIFLIGATLSFFLAFLVFDKKGKTAGDYVLFAWIALIGFQLINHYLHTTGFLFSHPHLLGIGIALPMLQGPFMFVYVLVMINENVKFKPIYLLNSTPFLLVTMFFMFDFYFLNASEKLTYYESQVNGQTPIIQILTFPNIILGPTYLIWTLILLRKHMKNIKNNFSYTEKISLRWLKYILVGMGFVWIAVIFANIVSSLSILTDSMHDHVIYLAATIVMFFLGYFGIKQKAIYSTIATNSNPEIDNNLNKTEKKRSRYKKSGLKKTEAEVQLKKLLDYFENDKPYLNGKLNLKEVADHIDTSVNHLSQIINELLDKSFFDFVNGYRVEEVRNLLSDSKNKQYTLLAVAYESGFNSKSSFNSIFKKITGLTPSQYSKQQTG